MNIIKHTLLNIFLETFNFIIEWFIFFIKYIVSINFGII